MSSNASAPLAASPSLVGLYKALWQYAEGARLNILVSNSLLVGSQLLKLTIPWLTAQAINAVQLSGTGGAGQAATLILLILLATVASWAMHGPGRIIERSVAVRVRQQLSDRLYERVAGLPLAWHDQHHSGETLHRVSKTTLALSDFAQSQFVFAQNFVNLVGPIIALMLLSTVTGSVALVGFLLIGFVIVRFDRILMRLVMRQNEAERRYSAGLVDALGNVATIVSLRLQHATRALLTARLLAVFAPLRRNIVVNETKWCVVDLLTITLTWGMVALYAWSSQRGGATLLLGNVFMVYQYANQAGGVIYSLAMNYQNFARMQADYTSADPIWNASCARAPQGALPPHWRQIGVDRLEFRYARIHRNEPLLNDAALDLRRGESIALVGPSGSGKSTLMRVLAGLYDADRVRLTVDGIVHVAPRNLAVLATLIPQDAEVFEGSVLENLTFGAECPPGAVTQALRISGFAPVLETLPQGLETVITERGLNLSGGQRQRLALARGLLAARESSILFLDEPTSSLDALTEARVFAELRSAMPHACIVAAVHRLNLLPGFDRVVLMEGGAVVDTGSVEELLERQPLFRELWQRSVAGTLESTDTRAA